MTTPIPQRACAHCGKLFFPQAANQAYHNDLCRQNAYRHRAKTRRGTKQLNVSEYFNTYFAQVFQDVTPTTAQAIWQGARQDPKRRYAVFSWTDIPNTTIPCDIEISIEQKDGIAYHNVHKIQSPVMLKYLEEHPEIVNTQLSLSDKIKSNPTDYATT